MSVLENIRQHLKNANLSFKEIHHAPTKTSQESAQARGEELRNGGKALLLKVDGAFRLFVLSAAKQLDSHAIKDHFGVKKSRFASREELMELTGLVPGCVPPFGEPILPFELYVDESIFANERIAFNAGSLTDSIIMSVEDYLQLTQPKTFKFSE